MSMLLRVMRGQFRVPKALAKHTAEGIRDPTERPPLGSRWSRVLPAVFTHACIGSPYAWSLMAEPATRELGVVAGAAGDWSMLSAAGPMSLCFAFHGISAALLGKIQINIGPRLSCLAGAACMGTGVLTAAAGMYLHNLPLIYIGYGPLAGFGLGFAYTPALQTLVEYFPDRKALASGFVIGGFGLGPVIWGKSIPHLRGLFQKDPEFVGLKGSVDTFVENGALFTKIGGVDVKEVVLATKTDLAISGLQHLNEGYYIVGSGSTGCAGALAVTGAAFFTTMFTSSLLMTRPNVNYSVATPVAKSPAPAATNAAASSSPAASSGAIVPAAGNVNVDTVMTIPQFYMIATCFLGCAASGMAMMGVAKPMMASTFATTMPDVVTPEFAAAFVIALSGGNLTGRLLYPLIADSKVGFKRTFQGMTMLSAGMLASSPFIIDAVVSSGNVTPLYAFVCATTTVMSVTGGAYAVVPAYEALLFGSKYLAANHGRMLICSTIAAIGGPSLLSVLLTRETSKAISDLLGKVDPEVFKETFGASIDHANDLVAAGTVNIARLMEIAPAGTLDPSPFLYNTTFYAMAGVMCLAGAAVSAVKPIDSKYFEENQKKTIASEDIEIIDPAEKNDTEEEEKKGKKGGKEKAE